MLTLIKIPDTAKLGGNFKALYKCDCGNETWKNYKAIKYGKGATHCGCNQKPPNLRHGKHRDNRYRIFHGIRQRCNNPKSEAYKYYGGRGIKCEWDKFEDFLKAMGERPSLKHSIDRINPDGNYCKENCRWATMKEQANNKRIGGATSPKLVIHNGETKNLSDWAKYYGISRQGMSVRYHLYGAIEKPVNFIRLPKQKEKTFFELKDKEYKFFSHQKAVDFIKKML